MDTVMRPLEPAKATTMCRRKGQLRGRRFYHEGLEDTVTLENKQSCVGALKSTSPKHWQWDLMRHRTAPIIWNPSRDILRALADITELT